MNAWLGRLFLLLVVCIGFWVYGYNSSLFYRPSSTHMSRQSDCASYALNYYQNDLPFLEPQTHTLTGDGGHAVSEFPVLYYAIGKLYKQFGYHEWIHRSVMLVFFVLGVLAAFELGLLMVGRPLLALIPAVVFFTSPYLVYYGNNYLVNVGSLSLVVMGWWAYMYYRSGARSVFWIWVSSVLFLVAILLKVDAGISYVGLLALMAFDQLKGSKGQYLFHKLTSVMLVLGGALAWVLYARWFNEHYHTGQNLLGVIPIWGMSLKDIISTSGSLIKKWSLQFHNYVVLLLFIGVVYRMFKIRKVISKADKLVIITTALSSFLYVLLFFEAFKHHDYYMINLFILPLLVLMVYLKHEPLLQQHINKKMLMVGLVLVTAFSLYYAHSQQVDRYEGSMKEYAAEGLYTITPYLRSIGVTEDDIVVSVPDLSPNVSLYLMNNFGWTEAFNGPDYNINYFVGQGAKYLIVSDTNYLQQPLYQPYTQNPIGQYKGISIYKLQ